MDHKTLEMKATTTEMGEFTAIAAAYSVDRVNERIVPGAFQKSIEQWRASGKNVPLHWDHSGAPEDIIGTVDPASMQETEQGLEVKGQLDLQESTIAKEAWRLMKKNAVSLSFGYLVLDSAEAKDGVRDLKALDVFEISITPAPANPDTRFLSMKGMTEGDLEERLKRLEEAVFAPEVKDTEASGDEPAEEKSVAVEDAKDEEPTSAKSSAQDPLRRRGEELAFRLGTEGVDLSQPPEVKEAPKPTPELGVRELRQRSHDLMLQLLVEVDNESARAT